MKSLELLGIYKDISGTLSEEQYLPLTYKETNKNLYDNVQEMHELHILLNTET